MRAIIYCYSCKRSSQRKLGFLRHVNLHDVLRTQMASILAFKCYWICYYEAMKRIWRVSGDRDTRRSRIHIWPVGRSAWPRRLRSWLRSPLLLRLPSLERQCIQCRINWFGGLQCHQYRDPRRLQLFPVAGGCRENVLMNNHTCRSTTALYLWTGQFDMQPSILCKKRS